jgi:hypothetical protein
MGTRRCASVRIEFAAARPGESMIRRRPSVRYMKSSGWLVLTEPNPDSLGLGPKFVEQPAQRTNLDR